MNRQTREIQYFLTSQYFSDGLRITLGVLLPSLIFAQFNLFATGLSISVGAFCASITDSPGPLVHRRNGILICGLFIFLVSLVTELVRDNTILLGAEILLFSFFFSMFTVYGNRAAAIGVAALLVMIMNMKPQLSPDAQYVTGFLVLAGSLWYMLLSLLIYRIMPYRQAQQALGECIHDVAEFLRLKAAFYNPNAKLEESYNRMVSQQIIVSEKQDAVREHLFKSRLIVKESTNTSRTLVLIFVDVVDLYEQIMTIHYDYASLRERFGKSGILNTMADLIHLIADELDQVGYAIQSNTQYKSRVDFSGHLETLKVQIDAWNDQEGGNLALKKILVNLRNLFQRLNDILNTYETQSVGQADPTNKMEYSRFVSHQDFSLKILRDNLSPHSGNFKHAVRVSVASFMGFLAAFFLPNEQYGYWIILTILVILKPGFSLTRQRNYQRLLGTLLGGAIGLLILLFIPDKTVQFVFLLIFMLGSYSFLRSHYFLMVIFVTPMVLILFNFMGAGSMDVVYERIIDTLIGCGISFATIYLVFPSWESEQLQNHMLSMLKANAAYLQKVAESFAGNTPQVVDYKLARKQVYVSSANLSATFQRMLTEPKSKQKNSKEVHQFVVLNHILSSYIATVASSVQSKGKQVWPPEYLRLVRRSLASLCESTKLLDSSAPYQAPELHFLEIAQQENDVNDPDDALLKEQLEFIRKVSEDIARITESVLHGVSTSERTSLHAA